MAKNTNANVAPKAKKEPVPAIERITATLKRETLRGKLTKEELGKVSELANALVHFVA